MAEAILEDDMECSSCVRLLDTHKPKKVAVLPWDTCISCYSEIINQKSPTSLRLCGCVTLITGQRRERVKDEKSQRSEHSKEGEHSPSYHSMAGGQIQVCITCG